MSTKSIAKANNKLANKNINQAKRVQKAPAPQATAYETLCLALANKIEKNDPSMAGLAGMVGTALAEESKNPQAVAQRAMAMQAAMFGAAMP